MSEKSKIESMRARRWMCRYKLIDDWTDWLDFDGPNEPTANLFCAKPEFFETRAWYPVPPDTLAFPKELTPDLREVLGWPNFKCGPVAHVRGIERRRDRARHRGGAD